MAVYGLDHVQLAMPAGEEDTARAFYIDVLGLEEQSKPPQLAGRGGVWFTGGSLKLHLGVDPEFHPAKKAHPALLVNGLQELVARCKTAGCEMKQDVPLEGFDRIHVFDPFGNRIELLEPTASSAP